MGLDLVKNNIIQYSYYSRSILIFFVTIGLFKLLVQLFF